MKSILQSKKESYISEQTYGLEEHHIYFGTGKRKISEQNGFKVWLTYLEHRGTYGVHGKYGHELDLRLKQECQKEYEKNHTREEFIRLIGKSYLDQTTGIRLQRFYPLYCTKGEKQWQKEECLQKQ